MRSFAKRIITETAVSSGLDAGAVMDRPEKETVLLPEKRIQLDYLDEKFERKFKLMARTQSEDFPDTHRVIRSRLFTTDLIVRADVKANDEAWLETFVNTFLVKLPYKVAGPENDLVIVQAVRAVRSGFDTRMVEVFKKRSNALHITFKGMICKNVQVPLITDVNVKDGVQYI